MTKKHLLRIEIGKWFLMAIRTSRPMHSTIFWRFPRMSPHSRDRNAIDSLNVRMFAIEMRALQNHFHFGTWCLWGVQLNPNMLAKCVLRKSLVRYRRVHHRKWQVIRFWEKTKTKIYLSSWKYNYGHVKPITNEMYQEQRSLQPTISLHCHWNEWFGFCISFPFIIIAREADNIF